MLYFQMWNSEVNSKNQFHISRSDVFVSKKDLLQLPQVRKTTSYIIQVTIRRATIYKLVYLFLYFQGGFTLQGLQNNITVGILFIDAWLRGEIDCRSVLQCDVSSS